jgi:hypothetical protein
MGFLVLCFLQWHVLGARSGKGLHDVTEKRNKWERNTGRIRNGDKGTKCLKKGKKDT